ncbi:MAG TPA: hypothetical protein VLF61_01530 [Rhabdochlamydiaceae bacterium]|nr:hypothetical protein [Rhabdochlamydiaceae bacterium]
MKKDNKFSNQALARVKQLFTKEPKKAAPNSRFFGPERAYDYLKLPRMLMGKQHLDPAIKGKQEWSKKQVSCNAISQCSLSPKYLMHLLLELKSLQKNRKVKKLYLKEHLLAKRNFQNMGKEMHEWMASHLSHKVKPISEDKIQEEDEHSWEDYHRHKEERQFLITRVIKYLLD